VTAQSLQQREAADKAKIAAAHATRAEKRITGYDHQAGASPRRYHEALALRGLLVELFPEAFARLDQPKKPLKIGIRGDINVLCPEINWTQLAIFLSHYCTRPSYLDALVEDAVRVDLFGAQAGEVSAEHARCAQEMLAAIRKRMEKAAAEATG
jgi:sRNA-binding protein